MSNRKMKSLSDLPTMCYAEMDGKLCIITRGEKGWKRASISAENSAANQELAALKNRELGVSPEDARLLVTGAVVGWDAWITPEKKPSAFREIFEVEISRSDSHSGYSPTAIVKLPATWAELSDALDKINALAELDSADDQGICKVDVWDSRPECMEQMIPKDANLFELNHLAERLTKLDDFEMCAFEGLMTMDAVRTDYEPIPLERLINMTHSLADCQIAYEAHDDEALGKFYVDNDFPVIPPDLPEILYDMLDYESIGRKTRMGEGGVFTPSGYVVHSGEMSTEYSRDKLQKPEKPPYTIMLEVCKGFFNDPAYDSSTSEFPMLPADCDIFERAIKQVGAESIEEYSVRVDDCIVPRLTELVSDALYASEGDCCGEVNELALQLKKLDDDGMLTVYRAMIEVAPDDLTLEEAIDLSHQAADFSLLRELTSPDEYAKAELKKCDIPLRDELLAYCSLWDYGKKLMEQNLAVTTAYGVLRSNDGVTVEQCLERQEPEQIGMCQSMT